MDDMDEDGRTRTDTDDDGRARTTTEERIQQRIQQLEREQAEFAVAAPVRADERLQGFMAQLQQEIEMRMKHYQEQIDTLKELLAEPAKEGD